MARPLCQEVLCCGGEGGRSRKKQGNWREEEGGTVDKPPQPLQSTNPTTHSIPHYHNHSPSSQNPPQPLPNTSFYHNHSPSSQNPPQPLPNTPFYHTHSPSSQNTPQPLPIIPKHTTTTPHHKFHNHSPTLPSTTTTPHHPKTHHNHSPSS
ncbi:hypothetical protein Pcinc_017745 [Petrolisthes cinctipes]|uniref:Uncharacterized protein n=1 Tax=Petrolisthes cinctipes TaxID=88211 RepID=A0AAE1KNF5_PETCI|nr:hypothetical protein Pcinc_017745 [Petrolisthes cinctipes]